MENALDAVRSQFDTKQQTMSLVIPDETVFLEADPARLEQILFNLLHNASKYTQNAGQIWVSVAAEPAWLVIRVRDNGVGISEDMLPRVFDLFAQVDRSLDRAQGGLGIGLTLVKNLVGLHGGTIEVKSAGADQGSEFAVRLPALALAESGEGDHTSKARSSDPPGSARRVLIVDDNVTAAETLTLALEMRRHQVQSVYDAQRAIEVALETKPDAILLDIGLPGLSGYEVAKRLRAEPALAHMLIIAVTGYGREEDLQRSAEALIDAHLVKPIDPSELDQLLRAGRTQQT